MPGFCSFSRMVRRVSRKPGFSSACESPSASSPPSCLPNTVSQAQTYSLQLSLCLPAVVGICCECGLNATPQAGSVHIESQAAAEPCADQRCSSGEFGGDRKKGCGIARPLGSLWCCHGTGWMCQAIICGIVWWAVTSRHRHTGKRWRGLETSPARLSSAARVGGKRRGQRPKDETKLSGTAKPALPGLTFL